MTGVDSTLAQEACQDTAVSGPREAGEDGCGHRDERIRGGWVYEEKHEEMDAATANEWPRTGTRWPRGDDDELLAGG